MPLRRLLNVAYAALAQGRDDDGLKELDESLEVLPGERARRRPRGDFKGVMAAARMPQGTG